MPSLRDLTERVGAVLKPLLQVAATYFAQLADTAETFRNLIPLGAEGWAISTYGILLAPDAHKEASETTDQALGSELLEEAWSDASVRREICSLVPWTYPREQREIGRRRMQLLERASDRYSEGLYEEAVLLVYSQLDGVFQDRADEGEVAFSRLFSRRPVSRAGDAAKEFTDVVTASRTMLATEEQFFLVARELMSASVQETILTDHASRHGVLHGRVLGYGTRRRAAQSFAFLAAALELLIASREELPLSDYEAYQMPPDETPRGLQLILQATAWLPVRSVYLQSQKSGRSALVAVPDSQERS